jgi:hypothetical protein
LTGQTAPWSTELCNMLNGCRSTSTAWVLVVSPSSAVTSTRINVASMFRGTKANGTPETVSSPLIASVASGSEVMAVTVVVSTPLSVSRE